jgi:hypothetical protein
MLKIIQDEKIDEEIIKMHTPISKLLCIIALSAPRHFMPRAMMKIKHPVRK